MHYFMYEQNRLMYTFTCIYQICCYIAIYMLFHLLEKLILNTYNTSSGLNILFRGGSGN